MPYMKKWRDLEIQVEIQFSDIQTRDWGEKNEAGSEIWNQWKIHIMKLGQNKYK